ncbi:MAG: hypothetical protein NZM11_00470 [Anaerolineales bacterium]|nr:hypothetical protein [Anaerolineales bacterium]
MSSKSSTLWGWLLLLLTPAVVCAATTVLRPLDWRPQAFEDAGSYTIYAYRQWQSVGIRVERGDVLRLTASGQWQYSPLVGLHGPEGGGKPVTVNTYPLSTYGAFGGTLLGRIGEDGPPFVVGRGTSLRADAEGMLYFRINDDLLGDNEGTVTVKVSVERAAGNPSR